jgi:hypothetical protein
MFSLTNLNALGRPPQEHRHDYSLMRGQWTGLPYCLDELSSSDRAETQPW